MTIHSTTSVSNTATLKYSCGADLTAAAGIRLSLRLFLNDFFILRPFQVNNFKIIT